MKLLRWEPYCLAIVWCSLLLVSGGDAYAQSAKSPEGAQVVAEINERQITKNELDLELKAQLGKELHSFNEDEQHFLKSQMLARMIERELLLQTATGEGLLPTDAELADFLKSISSGLATSEGLEGELKKYGLAPEEFSQSVRQDLAIKRYLDKHVFVDISPSEEELRAFYRSAAARYTHPEQVRARHILLEIAKEAKESDIKLVEAKAKEILAKAKKPGANFSALAKDYSQAPNASKGGDLGFFTRNQLEPAFVEAAFGLEVGQISELIRTRFGFHILKVEEKRPAGIPEFDEIRERVLKDYLQNQRKERLKRHLKTLRAKNKVIIYYR